MALGLSGYRGAERRGDPPDMMLIDEGIWFSDAQSRQQAIKCWGELAGDSRTVGIISHVTELKEQIDRKLVVSRKCKAQRVVWTE